MSEFLVFPENRAWNFNFIVFYKWKYEDVPSGNSMLGKTFSILHFEIIFLFFLENRISLGDSLHEVSDPIL